VILDKSFTNEWLEEKRRELKCDKILLERATRALQLLELIAVSGAEFTFKGGTSMMLLTEEFSRLSIDLDIVVNPGAELTPIFEEITQVDRHKFTAYEEDIRNRLGIQPFRHYKFYFNSVNPTQRNSYVLLDVLYEEPLHAEYVSKSIKC